MRYMELLGKVDDTFAKYRKEECTPDSEWQPYSFYKNLTDVYDSYSVYCGDVKAELVKLIDFYLQDQNIKFTEQEYGNLFTIFETANSQNNDNDAWTDIMFRVKFNFIRELVKILDNYEVDS